jgi:hypothetical protein
MLQNFHHQPATFWIFIKRAFESSPMFLKIDKKIEIKTFSKKKLNAQII